MADIDPRIARGRSPGPSWQELLAEDSRPVPAFLAEDHYRPLGSEPIPVARYTSEAFAALERERLWPHVWQFAAREEDLPEAGDFAVFDNAGRSWLIVRQPDGAVRAFHNVCLHRGRKLKTQDGWAGELQCPFHGFSWNTDGSLKTIPCAWDFPDLSRADMQLPEAEVGRWGGIYFPARGTRRPLARRIPRPAPRTFRALAARGVHDRDLGRQGSPRQLEGDERGLPRSVAHRRHPPATAAVYRRQQLGLRGARRTHQRQLRPLRHDQPAHGAWRPARAVDRRPVHPLQRPLGG